ncbi:MAG: ABC transporter substrate-binding protein [Alphaproteobacteria bacterium]
MTMLRAAKRIVVLGILFFQPFASVNAAPDSAVCVVKDFQAGILDVLKNIETLDIQGRYNLVAPLTKKNMHLTLMAATASSPYWRDGSRSQKADLVNAFHRLGASSIATLFDEYDGEVFKIWRSRKTSGPTVLVDTKIGNPNDPDPTEVTYVTAKIQGRWWIIDVIVAGGISEVKVRKNEFSAVLQKGGLDELISVLNARADRLLSGKEKAVVGSK